MTTPGLWQVSIPPGELEKSGNWRSVGSLSWSNRAQQEGLKFLSRELTAQVLRFDCKALPVGKRKVKKTWYRAGYCHQRIDDAEAHRELLPLGESLVVMPVREQPYRLSVWAFRWLPSLRITVEEYTGPLGPAESTLTLTPELAQQLNLSGTWFSQIGESP